MITSEPNPKPTRPPRVAIVATLFALFASAVAVHAQEPAKDGGLNAKFLIGKAVSLSNKSYPEIDKAIQRFRNGDFLGATEYLNRAKEKYPKLPPSDVMMAKMYLAARNGRATRVLLERAIVQHPEDPDAYLILANQAFAAKMTAEAYAMYHMAQPLVEKFSDNAKRQRDFNERVLAGLSAVAQRRAQWDKAYQLLKKWTDAEPDNAVAHARLAVVLFQLDKPKEALAKFTIAHDLNPDLPHPHVSLGKLYTQRGDLEKAQKSFVRAYNEDKTDDKVAQAYAEWLIQQRKLDEAQKIATSLRKKSPNSTTALMLDGVVAYMKGQPDRAEQALQKVLSLEPRNARATDLLALLLIASDKVEDQERALSHAQLNAERFPDNPQAAITKAWVLYQLGRTAEWNAALKNIGGKPVQPDSTYLIARILLGEGQKAQAKKALEQVVNQKSGLTLFRTEAEELLKQLEAEGI